MEGSETVGSGISGKRAVAEFFRTLVKRRTLLGDGTSLSLGVAMMVLQMEIAFEKGHFQSLINSYEEKNFCLSRCLLILNEKNECQVEG